MNGDTEPPTTRAPRKPRPEIQIYRPGMLRQGGSTKSLAQTTNDERPPRPEKLATTATSTTSSVSSRRRSNDTDSVTSRGGSGSTTPDAQAMNERSAGRNRFERGGDNNGRRNHHDATSNYNSTQSLYDTRQQGGYMEYNGGGRSNRNGGGGGRFNNQSHYQNNSHQNQRGHPPTHQQPFERPGNNSRGFNERASIRGDSAIARRPQGSRRQRNDSINSTQSEMPPNTGSHQLHIDTSFDSASQCGGVAGASSNFSMNSLGEAFSFEEMCQNLQNFASMDWSKEVENEFAMQKELEEEEERRMKEEEEELQRQMTSPRKNRKRNNRKNNRYDESDRESSFGGSIAEEAEDPEEEELKSGERTPTSVRSGQSYNPRLLYQRPRNTVTNDENHHGRRQKEKEVTPKKEPRRYRGEHDDRDADDTTEYTAESHMGTGRLAGRITIVPRTQNVQTVVEGAGGRTRHHKDEQKIYQKRSRNESEMANRAEINRRRQEEIERNEGKRIREIGEKMDKLSAAVKKRDLKAAEKIFEFSLELANIYCQVILQDIIYSFTAGLEQKLFRQAFYKSIECLRTGSNSTSPDARLIRSVTQKLLLNGILFYEKLISECEQQYQVALNDTLTWKNGWPTEEELCDSDGPELPIGAQKYESATQKTAIKSLSRHLISLGDLHRYKSLIDGSENYETAKSYYQKSSQLWPSTGHPYNQLGIVVYYSMLYRSARRARLVPVDVLSKQRQKRVIDEFFYLTRALSCSHPYEVARDRLKQRLDAMRTKVSKYQPVLDKECGIVKEQGNTLRKLQIIRQIWIHPITEATQDGIGEKVVDDILSHFMDHSKAKLHRRAVSYLSDSFGLLVTKIGMDHFDTVSERAFGLLYASLAKTETDFSADQLVKLAAMFIYAVQTNFEKASTSSSTFQLQISINTVSTFFLVLLEHLPIHKTLILPALNIISTWFLHVETDEILKTCGHLEPLESTILSGFSGLERAYDASENSEILSENSVYPEAILMASFFKIFEPIPIATGRSRMRNLKEAVDKVNIWLKKAENSKELEQKLEDLEMEEPKSRAQIVEEERGKGKGVIVILPEYLIPDTNVFIGELELIKNLLAASQNMEKMQILVPTIVLDELQSISKLSPTDSKSNSESHDPDRISKAKIAVNWLKEQSKTKNLYTLTTQGTRLPSLLMAAEDLEGVGKMTNDDMILKSAVHWSDSLPPPSATSPLQQIASTITSSSSALFLRNCVLITGDRGLTIKAIGSNLPCRGIANFTKWLGV